MNLDLNLAPLDNARLANLCGPVDAHIRAIATAFELRIARRNEQITLTGDEPQVREAALLLQQLYDAADQPLDADYVQLAVIETRSTVPNESMKKPDQSGSSGTSEPLLLTRRHDLRGRTPTQKVYLRNIATHDATFGIGPAGTGKTYLAVACAVDAFERDTIKRIVLVRPAVEAGERLGFLPGDLTQKVDPYLRPLYDALYDLMGFDKVQRMFEKQAIEVAPLAYMRGRTLNHSFIILDEAQNTTPEQMKMFLTRIGFGTKAVITGDVTQVDLAKNQKSGLNDASEILRGIRGIAFTEFTSADVVRHPLVGRIVQAYEARSAAFAKLA